MTQTSLFDDDLPGQAAASPVPAGVGLALSALKFAQEVLSAQQKRFNQLLERTEMLASKIAAMRAAADVHRLAVGTTLRPLEDQRHTLMRDMALWLDERLKRSGLTRNQQQLAGEIIRNLALGLALMGMEDMRAVHDAHSDISLADQEQAGADETQAFLEAVLGEAVGGDQAFASPEEVLQAGMERRRQQAQAHAEARAAHQARRAKGRGKPQEKQHAKDAEGALRLIYRQLASALHPDRESDPAEHARKTSLMSEANAAYGRRDLLALLQLQLRADLADARKVSTMAKEKVAAMTVLLKERVDVLSRELRDFEGQVRAEFDLPPYVPLGTAGLRRHVQEQKQSLQAEITMMQHDLRLVQTDAAFKRWLREQHRLARDEDRFGSPF